MLGASVLRVERRPSQSGRSTAAEVDTIAAYSPELHRGFLIPISEVSGRRSIHLRLDPTKNNQADGIKWARDYEFASAIDRLRSGMEQETYRARAATLPELVAGL
jgi:hypothetical protein